MQLLYDNETFHQHIIEKVKIPYQQDGYERSYEVALIDFDNWQNNTFLAVNQYTIIENGQNKRRDVLLFVNGIPLIGTKECRWRTSHIKQRLSAGSNLESNHSFAVYL